VIDIAALSESKVFAGLSDRELRQVAQTAALQNFAAGALVFGEDDVASNMYLVTDGRVALKMRSRAGQEVIIDELGPGEVAGWSSTLEDQRYTASLSAVEPSTLLVFDGPRLRQLFHKDQSIGNRVLGNMLFVVSGRLGHLRSRLVDAPFAPEWLTSPTHDGPVGPPCAAGAMSEMKSIACPACAAVAGGPMALVNETAQYRCRNCGMVFYAPACCESE
jgi:hypothetical protein